MLQRHALSCYPNRHDRNIRDGPRTPVFSIEIDAWKESRRNGLFSLQNPDSRYSPCLSRQKGGGHVVLASSNAQSSRSQYFLPGRLNGWFILFSLARLRLDDESLLEINNTPDAELSFHGTARGRIPTDSSRFFPMPVQRYPSQANTSHKLGLDRQACWRYDNVQTFVLGGG